MLTTTRRGPGLPGLMAMGLLFVLPAMAEAQLFPNRPIRRQRDSCAIEPPFYAQVRREYFGYFPTCWSRFPEGWACPCPNPELPNPAREFQLRPRDVPRNPDAAEPAPGAEPADPSMPENPPATDPNLPQPPERGRSPFDLDTRPDSPATPARPDPSTPSRAPNTNAPPRPGDNPSVPPASRSTPPTTFQELPAMPATSPTTSLNESRLEPGSMVMAPEATLTSNSPAERPEPGPLPSTPATNPVMMGDPGTMVGGPPAQAPQRRSLLGGLFGSGNRRRR